MKCLLKSTARTTLGLLTLCIALEAFPYICSDCFPDDERCILKCSLQGQETNNLDSMSNVNSNRKRFQQQLRFGKRGPVGVTDQANDLEESFRPQLRFGKRSRLPSKRRFMSHMRFGKRDFQFDYKSLQPQERSGRIPDAEISSLDTPRSSTGVLEIPAIFYGQGQEKRFRPQGRFGKRLRPGYETISETNNLPLYKGSPQTTSKEELTFDFDDMAVIGYQLPEK
ncbi:hypothetical protein KP79_PYT04740 [Mizuhopecten yessoensis]|uniref:LRFamide n=1 Tax=Mizuhopecten yessoensis TaxID=6573 RepID=A0A210PLP4_MIZYE|nr:LRFamide [Mizuhopecten yessoensis]OWF37419.1 hypothetical protein KP79_PYT04740 [Mizuhopecten yessoensis]